MLTRRHVLDGLPWHGEPTDDDHEAGFTLAEMLVVIVILGVIGSMLSTWFIAGIKTTSRVVTATDDQNATHNAIQQLGTDLELAVPDPSSTTAGPLITATHDSLSMYTNINGLSNPALVTWSVTSSGGYNGSLVRTYTPPSVSAGVVSWPSSGKLTRTELQGVNDKNDGKIPALFRYLDATGAQATQMCTDATPAPSPCATPLTATGTTDPTSTQVPNIVAVEVYLQVATAGDGAAGSTAPYYETRTKAGVPYVIRTRFYPQINTTS